MADRSTHLLLLREADVVRLCGLATAARALELVRGGDVTNGSRADARLTATVRSEDDQEYIAWLEAGSEPAPTSFSWSCSCSEGQLVRQQARLAAGGAHLACVHVAALLTAWVRNPGHFLSEGAPAGPTRTLSPSTGGVPINMPRPQPSVLPLGEERKLSTGTLRDYLERLSEGALKTARQRIFGDASDAPYDGPGLLAALHEALTDPVLLATVCATLDDASLLLLRGVLLNGGALTGFALDALGARAGFTQAAQIVARHALRACCLLFAVGDDASPAGWVIPADIVRHLDIGLGLRPLAMARSPREPAPGLQSIAQVEEAPLRALCLTLTLMARTLDQLRPSRPSAVVPSSRVPSVVDLPMVTDDADPPGLDAWASAAEVDQELARYAHRLARAACKSAGNQHPLLSLDRLPAEEWACALRMGVAAWLDSRTHVELVDLAHTSAGVRLRCDPRHPAYSLAVVAAENADARARVARFIGQIHPGSWYALDEFVALVWTFDPLFLRGRQRTFETPSWWIEDAQTARPLRPDIEVEWMRAEGQYIRVLIAGPLHRLGIVDVMRDDEGAVMAFRCSPWAPVLLGASPNVPVEAVRLAEGWGEAVRPAGITGISVQPLALAPNGSALLDAWACVTSVRGARLVWQFSADHTCANLDAQYLPAELIAWLRALDTRDGSRAAPHVASLLARWQRQYGASRVEREIVIVDAHDELALHEALAAVPELRSDAQLLAPAVAAFPRHAAKRLEQALAAKGYLVSRGSEIRTGATQDTDTTGDLLKPVKST